MTKKPTKKSAKKPTLKQLKAKSTKQAKEIRARKQAILADKNRPYQKSPIR